MRPQGELISTDTDDKHCPRCDSTELAPEREGGVCPVCEQRDD